MTQLFPSTPEASASLLRGLYDKVEALEAKVDTLLGLLTVTNSADDPTAIALMHRIQAAVGDQYLFCSADLITRTDSAALHAAIVSACGALSAKKLGQWIKQHEGKVIAGIRIVRTDRVEREGILWQLQVVAGSNS